MNTIKMGFGPVYNSESILLILGSFPSVKSRQNEFYYGNPQNRFWKTVCSFFGTTVPDAIEGKKEFLLANRVALWDIVTECEIEGSKDDTIKNFKVADLKKILQNSKIRYIILNGGKAFSIFESNYKDISIPYKKLPSTSPANTRFTVEEWHNELYGIFKRN